MNKDEQETLNQISKEVRDVDKIRHRMMKEMNELLESTYKNIKQRCPHKYEPKLSQRLFSYVEEYNCGYCNSTLTEQEYENYINKQ